MSDELRDELFEAFQGMHPFRTQIDDFVEAVLSIVEREIAAERADAWRDGFQGGWEASDEGYNGEWVGWRAPWAESAGYRAMICAEAVTQ